MIFDQKTMILIMFCVCNKHYFCTMKMLFIIVSLTLLLKPVFPVVEYLINYDYISTELCENKAKPEMHCNGKCHLAKEIAKTIHAESSNPYEKKVSSPQFDYVYFQEIQAIPFTTIKWITCLKITSVYSNIYKYLHDDTTFHPPTYIIG